MVRPWRTAPSVTVSPQTTMELILRFGTRDELVKSVRHQGSLASQVFEQVTVHDPAISEARKSLLRYLLTQLTHDHSAKG